jgi:hypothetical protein
MRKLNKPLGCSTIKLLRLMSQNNYNNDDNYNDNDYNNNNDYNNDNILNKDDK